MVQASCEDGLDQGGSTGGEGENDPTFHTMCF